MEKNREQLEEYLFKNLESFTHKTKQKYLAGKAEHKDDIMKLDVIEEIENEIMDLVVYLNILKFKLKK